MYSIKVQNTISASSNSPHATEGPLGRSPPKIFVSDKEAHNSNRSTESIAERRREDETARTRKKEKERCMLDFPKPAFHAGIP